MTKQLTTIELQREDMCFSAGHYTIFSPTKRERLHGHNFSVYAAIETEMTDNGMSFDYDIYKKILRELCQQLKQRTLLAGNSPHQTITQEGDYCYAHFNGEKIPFLLSDVLIMPLRNIAVEELSQWFIDQLIADTQALDEYRIHAITIKVYSAPGQGGSAHWRR